MKRRLCFQETAFCVARSLPPRHYETSQSMAVEMGRGKWHGHWLAAHLFYKLLGSVDILKA
jgi:hypothetical protein